MTREEQIREAAYMASMTEETIVREEVIKGGVRVGYKDVKLRDSKRPIARLFFRKGVEWADANPKSPWISVEEKLPDVGDKILEVYTIVIELNGFRKEDEAILVTRYNGEFCCNGSVEHMMGGTTCCTTHHWMPIPELPEEE